MSWRVAGLMPLLWQSAFWITSKALLFTLITVPTIRGNVTVNSVFPDHLAFYGTCIIRVREAEVMIVVTITRKLCVIFFYDSRIMQMCTDIQTYMYCRSVDVLTSCMRQPEKEQIFRQQQKCLEHSLPLGAYLLKPVQRILKYHLLLQVTVTLLAHSTNAFLLFLDHLLDLYEYLRPIAKIMY